MTAPTATSAPLAWRWPVAAAALVATGLAHVLLLSTPRPMAFFAWIVGLGTAVVVLFPFSTAAPLLDKVATALVDLVIGIAIGTLINGVPCVQSGWSAGRRPRRACRSRRPSGQHSRRVSQARWRSGGCTGQQRVAQLLAATVQP